MSVRAILLCAVFFMSLITGLTGGAQAACTGVVAGRFGPLHLAGGVPEGSVSITFLGHASFLIESPAGVRVVTDYNDMIRAPVTPDIVTMNNAHPTHYSEAVEPGVKYVLRGWDPAGGSPTITWNTAIFASAMCRPMFASWAGPATTATRSLSLRWLICASRISAICTTP
jgi:hypothetical protein